MKYIFCVSVIKLRFKALNERYILDIIFHLDIDFASIPTTLLGVVFFAKPEFIFGDAVYGSSQTLGILLVLIGSFMASCAHTIVRKLGKNVHFTVSILYFSFMGFLLSTCIILSTGGFTFPCIRELLLVMYMGPNGLIGLVCLTMALQREPAGRVTIIRASEIPFAYLLQILILSVYPDTYSIIGCCLVTFSAVSITARKLCIKRSH